MYIGPISKSHLTYWRLRACKAARLNGEMHVVLKWLEIRKATYDKVDIELNVCAVCKICSQKQSTGILPHLYYVPVIVKLCREVIGIVRTYKDFLSFWQGRHHCY